MFFLMRPTYRFGTHCTLSIQASEAHYCSPRRSMPELQDYSAVEVALFNKEGFILPEDLDLDEKFDDLWDKDDVAGYVPLARAMELLAALTEKYGEPETVPPSY